MNLVDATVTKILGEPYYKYGSWMLPVEYECYDTTGETLLLFDMQEVALNIKPGYVFQT